MDTASHHRWSSAHRGKNSEPGCLCLQLLMTVSTYKPAAYLEQVESRVKHLFYYFFQKLFEDSILINASLIDTQIIHKFHSDHSLHGVLGKLS